MPRDYKETFCPFSKATCSGPACQWWVGERCAIPGAYVELKNISHKLS